MSETVMEYGSFEEFLSDCEEWESLESVARACWSFAKECEELEPQLRETEAQRDDLLELVEKVEWYASMIYRCPWCRWYSSDGHAPDCPRQVALAKVRGEEEGP